jgi:hypothetical protein
MTLSGPNEIARGLPRRNEDSQGQAGEVVARQEAFRGQIAVGVELGEVRRPGPEFVDEKIELPRRLVLLADEPFVFVARRDHRAAVDTGEGLGERGLGCLVELSPAAEGLVEVIGQLRERGVDPRVGEPRGFFGQLGREVTDYPAEAGFDLPELLLGNLQPFANCKGQGHARGVHVHEAFQSRLLAGFAVEAGQADFGDGEGIEVGEQELAVQEVEPGRLHGSRHEPGLLVEKVAVVR